MTIGKNIMGVSAVLEHSLSKKMVQPFAPKGVNPKIFINVTKLREWWLKHKAAATSNIIITVWTSF